MIFFPYDGTRDERMVAKRGTMPSPKGRKSKTGIIKRLSKRLMKVFTSPKRAGTIVKPVEDHQSSSSAGTPSSRKASLPQSTQTAQKEVTICIAKSETSSRTIGPREECNVWVVETIDVAPSKLANGGRIDVEGMEKAIGDLLRRSSNDDTAGNFHFANFLLNGVRSIDTEGLRCLLLCLELSHASLSEEDLNRMVEVVDALCILATMVQDKVAEGQWPVSGNLVEQVESIKYEVNKHYREQLDQESAMKSTSRKPSEALTSPESINLSAETKRQDDERSRDN